MITVTESAKQQLGMMLVLVGAGPEVGLRLTATEPGQFGLAPDKEKEGDQVVEHEGSKVLLVDDEVSGALEGLTIDCEETPQGPRLVLSKE